MIVKCEKCEKKFKIPDEKVPKGKVVSQPCPGCNNKIIIDTRTDTTPTSEKHRTYLPQTTSKKKPSMTSKQMPTMPRTDRLILWKKVLRQPYCVNRMPPGEKK